MDGAERGEVRQHDGRRDRQGLSILSYEECLERIASAPVGRIAFRADDGLTILPVNHRLRGLQIAFRTAPGAKLDAALRGAEVAFEVDGFDVATRTGWSVLARGTAVPAGDTLLARSGELAPWADDVPREHWIVITIEHVTGRRIPSSERTKETVMTNQVNQIVDLSRGPIRDIKPLATLREAAIELSEEQVGALIVRDRRGVLGILTEFDISRALADGADPDDDRVRSFMTDRLVTIPAGASLREAADSMARHEIRHLLIVDGGGEPVGVVSARDLLTILGEPSALPS